ncbi:MAG: carbonic anhydrase family protein [Bdellovibrionota bacterium]
MAKLRLDQTAAWFLAITGALAIFIGGIMALKFIAGEKHKLKRPEELADKMPTDGSAVKTEAESIPEVEQDTEYQRLHRSEWSYEGESGTDHWADLSPEYADCRVGKFQSPIDIVGAAVDKDLRPIKFSYQPTKIKLKNTGNEMMAVIDNAGFITFGNQRFNLIRLNFHLPSEHKVNGVAYDMEFQLLHRSDKGELAVVSIFLEENKESNSLLEQLWTSLPKKKGELGDEVAVNFLDILPSKKDYYAYRGSKTMPPCSEGVQWLVLSNSTKIEAKQIDQFNFIFKYNTRPVQPLHGRTIGKSVLR